MDSKIKENRKSCGNMGACSRSGGRKFRDRLARRAALFCAAALLTGSMGITAFAEDTGYTTDIFKSEITVTEKQEYQVKETIGVNFKEARHGIYRYIPFVGNMYSFEKGEAQSVPYIAKLRNINVEGFNYETETSDGDTKIIKIGDEDTTLTGAQTYNIDYSFVMYNDEDNGEDVFYFNAVPNDWDTAIGAAEVTVHMPKAFDESKLSVYADKYGKIEGENVNVSVSGKDIHIVSTGGLEEGTGVTLRIVLPEDYFQGVNSTAIFGIISTIVGAALLAFLVMMFLISGRRRKPVVTVEFYPPEDRSSAELGYAIDNSVDDEDLLSLIIYFASRGYITITESGAETESGSDKKKKKKQKTAMILTKVKDLPADAPAYQKTFFKGLFENADKDGSINIEDISSGFYKVCDDARKEIAAVFDDTEENNIYDSDSGARQVLMLIVSLVLYGAGGFLAAKAAGNIENMFLMIFPVIFYVFGMIIISRVQDLKNKVSAAGLMVRKVIAGILIFLASISVFFCMSGFPGSIFAPEIYTLAGLMMVVDFVKTHNLSVYGAELMGKLIGFRNFIAKAEKHKLETLVEENPSYFYDILPYAYALGVSDKWAKRFEDIPMAPPTWYRSDINDFTYSAFTAHYFMDRFDSCTRSFEENIQTHDISESSVGGGDYSGGFSGGGAGGGGGGAW